MAKIATDRTTIDLFAEEKRPGRPKTNPLPRDEQVRLNKRNQLKRDKTKGLKRIECKVSAELYDQLDAFAQAQQLSRSALIEKLLLQALAR
jgi:hypothetical protein